jgi:hypothetical protein
MSRPPPELTMRSQSKGIGSADLRVNGLKNP